MEQTTTSTPASREQPAQPTQPRPARKPYTPPAIVSETRLETRAGTPLSIPTDPLNTRNDYGL